MNIQEMIEKGANMTARGSLDGKRKGIDLCVEFKNDPEHDNDPVIIFKDLDLIVGYNLKTSSFYWGGNGFDHRVCDQFTSYPTHNNNIQHTSARVVKVTSGKVIPTNIHIDEIEQDKNGKWVKGHISHKYIPGFSIYFNISN